MNERQQAMYDFAMARVKPGNEDALKALLDKRFKEFEAARASGDGFNRDRMREMGEQVAALLTEEGAKEYAEWRARMREQRRNG